MKFAGKGILEQFNKKTFEDSRYQKVCANIIKKLPPEQAQI